MESYDRAEPKLDKQSNPTTFTEFHDKSSHKIKTQVEIHNIFSLITQYFIIKCFFR